MSVCKRCGGAGKLHEYQHFLEGTCFACHGTGTRQAPTPEQKEKWVRKAREKAALKRALDAFLRGDASE